MIPEPETAHLLHILARALQAADKIEIDRPEFIGSHVSLRLGVAGAVVSSLVDTVDVDVRHIFLPRVAFDAERLGPWPRFHAFHRRRSTATAQRCG